MSELTKITVKIVERLYVDFDRQADSLYLKRDAFLDHMIATELSYITQDMSGKRLSPAARRYISGELKRMGTRKVNVQIRKKTAEDLNKVVESTNIVRDAFINRLIFFLRSRAGLLEHLDLPYGITGSAFQAHVEAMPTSPLGAVEAIYADPLYYLRIAIEERHDTGLYLVDLGDKLNGFSCYLDDAQVPGTPEHAAAARMGDQMLDELANL